MDAENNLELQVIERLLYKLTPSHDVITKTNLARMAYKVGAKERALTMFQEVINSIPGHAYPETIRALLLLQEQFPERKIRGEASVDREIVQMSTLGYNGRFGNQINQYSFVKLAAQSQNLSLQTPDWIGRYVFDIDDDPLGPVLPVMEETHIDIIAALENRDSDIFDPKVGWVGSPKSLLSGFNIWGYFTTVQAQSLSLKTSLIAFKDQYQSLFSPAPWLRPATDAILNNLATRGKKIIAMHIRRGDMVNNPLYDHLLAPEQWYLDHLAQHWDKHENPVLYLASDDPNTKNAFKDYPVVTAEDLGIIIPGAEFYTDWFVLSQAHQVYVATSSFSGTAAAANAMATDFYCASFADNEFVKFDPWNPSSLPKT